MQLFTLCVPRRRYLRRLCLRGAMSSATARSPGLPSKTRPSQSSTSPSQVPVFGPDMKHFAFAVCDDMVNIWDLRGPRGCNHCYVLGTFIRLPSPPPPPPPPPSSVVRGQGYRRHMLTSCWRVCRTKPFPLDSTLGPSPPRVPPLVVDPGKRLRRVLRQWRGDTVKGEPERRVGGRR